MATSDELVVGALVNLDQYAPNKFRATEIPVPNVLKQPHGSNTIDWSFGPLKVSGYIDLDKREIGVNVFVVGISIGNIAGSLDEGVSAEIDLFVAKGKIRFYLKGGKDLWIHIHLSVIDKIYDGDFNIPFV